MNLPDLNGNENELSYHMDKTWVQCESPSCLKWRMVPKVNDGGAELDLDGPWHCHMNPDPLFSHCSMPQAPFPDNSQFKKLVKVVYSTMPAGSLVLVKAYMWPWWPAILSADPESGEYVMKDREGDLEKYHVEFLGKPHTRYWATVKNVELYHTTLLTKQPKGLGGKKDFRKSYEVAIMEAAKISDMECEDRLLICHFKPERTAVPYQERQTLRMKRDSEKMLRQCTSRQPGKGQPGSIEEIGDMLIIEGFRFKSAMCKEDLMLFS